MGATLLQDNVVKVCAPTNQQHIRDEQRNHGSSYYPHRLLLQCMARKTELRDFFLQLSWHAQDDMLRATLYVMRSFMTLLTEDLRWEINGMGNPASIRSLENLVDGKLAPVLNKHAELLVREIAPAHRSGRNGSCGRSVCSALRSWWTTGWTPEWSSRAHRRVDGVAS